MKKHLFPASITAMLIAVFFTLIAVPPGYSQTNSEEYAKLKKEYDKLTAERNNILIQTKSLLEYKSRAIELEKRVKSLEDEKELKLKGLQAEKENAIKTLQAAKESAVKVLEEEKARLNDELKSINEQIARISVKAQEDTESLKLKIQELEKNNSLLNKDREALMDSIEKLKIEYKIIPETRKQVIRLENEKNQLLGESKKAQIKLKALDEERINKDAQLEIYRLQINDLKKRYAEALAKNKEFEKKLEQMPERMAELARENKVLVKETAFTHYNLGVFYAKNKEYQRAIAEFEKAAELNPDDPYVYYNLGYIYAEYLPDRPKAIDNFRKFLKLCKSDDNDVDWVKKYILTWQTWEGKSTMK